MKRISKLKEFLSVTMVILLIAVSTLYEDVHHVSAAQNELPSVGTGSDGAESEEQKSVESDLILALTTDKEKVKAGLIARIKYDTAVLSLESVEIPPQSVYADAVLFPETELLENQVNTLEEAAKGKFGFAYSHTNNNTAEETIVIAKFNVKSDAKVGKSTISYEYEDASDENAKLLNVETKEAVFDVEATITVKPDSEKANDVQAAEEAEKLVREIMDGKQVKGIDKKLSGVIKKSVENYKTITIAVKSSEIQSEELTAEEKELVAEKISTQEVAGYYDMGLAVKIDNKEIGIITEIDNAVTVPIVLSENLPEIKEGKFRSYQGYLLNNGELENIPLTIQGDSITLKLNRFGKLILTYEDNDGIKGDANGDGIVDIADALMISRYDARLTELDSVTAAICDVNGDGATDVADALMISRFDAHLIDSLDIEKK